MTPTSQRLTDASLGWASPFAQVCGRSTSILGSGRCQLFDYILLSLTVTLPRYVPGYLDELREGHREELTLFKTQLSLVKRAVERGEEVGNSFGKYLLDRQAELELSDDETAYLAGSMFGAGSDTTASAISVAVMAAACYPEAQKRVQEELDLVVGTERGG